jgi:UDP-glucuronate 4-epimerase
VDHPQFTFLKGDIADGSFVAGVFARYKPNCVINLAAQAGVRYSLENPAAYIQSNIVGFANILEGCRQHAVGHLVYASSSSVYGANKKVPFTESDSVDNPVSHYAATKKSNELMAHTYSHLYGIPLTGLRYFTVYGPWGRPDMSPWLFTSAIFEGRPIQVFNNGNMERDFTYVDDIVEGTLRVADTILGPQKHQDLLTEAPSRVYNIGNNQPVQLMDYIGIIEKAVGKEAEKEFLPMQPGDMLKTYADTSALEAATGFRLTTPLEAGIARWVAWYRDYHGF